MSKTFYDAVYEAWRSGKNPDAVDPDRIWYDEAMGYEPEDCISRELRRITPRRQEENEYEEDEYEEIRWSRP